MTVSACAAPSRQPATEISSPASRRTKRITGNLLFVVPRGARLAYFDSHPKEAGFFGREGLRITAVFQLDDAQFEAYGARIEHEGGEYHYAFPYRAVSVAEAPDATSNVVAVFGLFDPATRRLCGHIAFSG